VAPDLATIARRSAEPRDEKFQRELFASSRADLAGLNDRVREPLIDLQFRAKRRQYAESYPDAQDEILVVDGVEVGELIVEHRPDCVRVVDVTVHPSHRGHGIASCVLADEIAVAEFVGVPVTLSVWSTNVEARRLYERLGFVVAAEGEGYLEMQRDSSPGRSSA
jgi:ribosomal protein S18 acetylase RimI-like enzyme